MRRLFFVVLGIVVVGVALVPIGATATPTPVPTDNTTVTPGANTSTPGGTTTSTPEPMGEQELISLIEQPGSWSQAEARQVYGWIRSNDVSRLAPDRIRALADRLSDRAVSVDVPPDVLDAVTDARATANSTGSGGSPNGSSVVAQVGPSVQVVDWEYSDGAFSVTVQTNIPTRVVVSDALGPISKEGATEIPQRSVYVDGTQTITMEVEEYRGAAAISLSTSSGAIYLSTGISASNPFEGGSPTVGWFGGASVAVLMFVGAGAWRLRRETNEPRIAKRGTKRRSRE